MSPALEVIAAKVDAGERLSEVDAQELASTPDIITLGMLADDMRRRRHGNRVTFVRVERVTATQPVDWRPQPSAGEVRVDVVPASIDAAVAAVASVRAKAGDTPVSGFSLPDLAKVAKTAGLSMRACLERLKSAGLDHISDAPLDDELDLERSLGAAAEAGIAAPRLTYHRSDADWLTRLRLVSRLQERFPVIRAVSPLPLGPEPAAPTTGYDDLKRVSIARLCAGSIDTIQVDWSLYGPKLAQVALTFGVDDFDNVSPSDDATSSGPRRTPAAEVRRNIEAAFLVSSERNGRWELMNR